MNNNTQIETKDRLMALLGLAASKKTLSEPCPSDEQLVAFMDDKLKGKARRAILAHLNGCQDCYSKWLDVASYLNELEPSSQRDKPYKENWLSRLFQGLETLALPWKVALPSAALAGLVLMVVYFGGFPNINKRINAAYSTAIGRYGAEAGFAMKDLALPWDDSALSFSPSFATPAKQAYGAGVWTGRAKLLGEGEAPLPDPLVGPAGPRWSDTRWHDYYAFGRWSVLVWMLTRTEQPVSDWNSYQHILESLRENLDGLKTAEVEAGRAVSAIERIQPLLEAVQHQDEPSSRYALSRELVKTMQSLSP